MGVDYLRIIGISELFMCLEGAATGAFQGLGKTIPPSVTGITFNLLRIPAAMLLSKNFPWTKRYLVGAEFFLYLKGNRAAALVSGRIQKV